MMMDDSAPIHQRRKLLKTFKNVLPRKRTVVAKVCRETYSKNEKKIVVAKVCRETYSKNEKKME